MQRKRRALVLGDEAARHPFRQSLPPHVCRVVPVRRSGWREKGRWRLEGRDLRDFLLAYCSGFMAMMVFIA